MDFTREPIIESVITPKEGCKLVVRSSKAASQEEFFVDSVEVVSFGHSLYFRSLERPKSFFVPASDYEVLEVREARMVLKNVGLDRTIKIGGGREVKKEKEEGSSDSEGKVEKKREKKRHSRRRRSKSDPAPTEEVKAEEVKEETALEVPAELSAEEQEELRQARSALLPPPATLISETIARYKDNALFKDAFFLKEEDEMAEEEGVEYPVGEEAPSEEFPAVSLPQPEYGSFEMTEEEEEEIHRQRKKASAPEESAVEPEVPKVAEDLVGDVSDESSTTSE